jgi:exodeoxyribonuclease V alpha subunit
MSNLPSISANPNNLTSLKGIIKKLFTNIEGFSAGIIIADNKESQFSIKLNLNENDAVILYGVWKKHPKFGDQFEAQSFEYDLKPSVEGLITYLSNNPAFYGIGKVRARKIATAFADNFEQILFEQPAKIQELGRIPESAIKTLQDEWKKNQRHNLVTTELASYGLSYAKAKKLLEDHSIDIVSKIKKNPYILIGLVSGYGFKTVDVIALRMGFPVDAPERLEAGINYVIQQNENQGNTWIEYNQLLSELSKELSINLLDAKYLQVIEKSIVELIQQKEIVLEVVIDPDTQKEIRTVANRITYEQEMFIVKTFAHSIVKLESDFLIEQLEHYQNTQKDKLNQLQFESCVNSFQYSISAFSGPAGSGKTYAIQAIIDAALHNSKRTLSVALAAPTGKAAKRMTEVTLREAKTIHRLLEYSMSDGKFKRNEDNKLDESIIIIDEFSMVNLPLFYSLLKAINFNRTRLILVGDHNQLPPVGLGNILRDVIQSKALPLVVLNQVMRNAGALRENSLAILNGQLNPTTTEDTKNRVGLKSWYILDKNEKQEQVLFALQETIANRLEKYGFDLLQDVQVLTPQHKGLLGTRSINIILQKLLQKKLYNVDVADVQENHKPMIYIGDKVIQTVNNYDFDIMNGSQGIVKNIIKKSEITEELFSQLQDWNYDHIRMLKADDYVMFIDFGNKHNSNIIALPKQPEFVNNLELAYCVSCHKAQGSEYPCVITICHSTHQFMLHRNWFYTAVTRSKECSIVIGDKKGLFTAVNKQETDRRVTYSQYFLSKFIAPAISECKIENSKNIEEITNTIYRDITIDNATVTPTVSTTSIPTVVPTLPIFHANEQLSFSIAPCAILESDVTIDNSDSIYSSIKNDESIDCALAQNEQFSLAIEQGDKIDSSNLSVDSSSNSEQLKQQNVNVCSQTINIFDDELAELFPMIITKEVQSNDILTNNNSTS